MIEITGVEKTNMQIINLNETIKVKLTPFGVDIYYHRFDSLIERLKRKGIKMPERQMPAIDDEGYTKFQLWNFIELYGEHIGLCKANVICDNNIYLEKQ